MLTGWRIASPEFAITPKELLSGEGAFLAGGRWNSKGTRVVYLGSSLALASMELLVHLKSTEVLQKYHTLSVQFDYSLMLKIEPEDLPEGWSKPSLYPPTAPIGDEWATQKASLILEVPSVTVMGESNHLLNPEHPDMNKLEVGEIRPFKFDPRVLKNPT